MKIDYTCASCGAKAVSVPEPGAKYGAPNSRVWVPHAPGCPVQAQVIDARARALARTGGRP